MTQHTASQVRTPLRSTRLVWAICLVLVAGICATTAVVLISNSDNASTASKTSISKSVGGPNEASRGAAAASSAGAINSGPNEASRGAAAASAAGAGSGAGTKAGGPDETLRGQAFGRSR
jgi:hypothetical protein